MTSTEENHRGGSSRDSIAGAGWYCPQPGLFERLMPPEAGKKRFSWLDPRTLWQARRNDLIAHFLADPADD